MEHTFCHGNVSIKSTQRMT